MQIISDGILDSGVKDEAMINPKEGTEKLGSRKKCKENSNL